MTRVVSSPYRAFSVDQIHSVCTEIRGGGVLAQVGATLRKQGSPQAIFLPGTTMETVRQAIGSGPGDQVRNVRIVVFRPCDVHLLSAGLLFDIVKPDGDIVPDNLITALAILDLPRSFEAIFGEESQTGRAQEVPPIMGVHAIISEEVSAVGVYNLQKPSDSAGSSHVYQFQRVADTRQAFRAPVPTQASLGDFINQHRGQHSTLIVAITPKEEAEIVQMLMEAEQRGLRRLGVEVTGQEISNFRSKMASPPPRGVWKKMTSLFQRRTQLIPLIDEAIAERRMGLREISYAFNPTTGQLDLSLLDRNRAEMEQQIAHLRESYGFTAPELQESRSMQIAEMSTVVDQLKQGGPVRQFVKAALKQGKYDYRSEEIKLMQAVNDAIARRIQEDRLEIVFMRTEGAEDFARRFPSYPLLRVS